MTNLQALQAMMEYSNDNLLAKALTDRAVASSGTYTTANQRGVELSAADIYLILCAHPEFRSGSRFESYAKGALMSLRRELLRKWGELTDTILSPGAATGTTHAERQIW